MLSVDITGGNSRSLPNVIVEPERLTLHDLLVVYPVTIAIVKNLSFRQLIALAQTDKDCFAFLRGGGWGVDVRRWNNIRSKCSEICEFSDYHDYFDPIKEIRACRDCKSFSLGHGPSTYTTNTLLPHGQSIAKYLGERNRAPCVEKRLAAHPRYQSKTEFLDCQCTNDQDPWLCRPCWKVKYFACWHGPADICADRGINVEDVNTEIVVCTWCQAKVL